MGKERVSGKKFSERWNKYREDKYIKKDEEGNIIENRMPKNTQKKKQIHFDSMESYKKLLAWYDSIEKAREEAKEVKLEGEKESE